MREEPVVILTGPQAVQSLTGRRTSSIIPAATINLPVGPQPYKSGKQQSDCRDDISKPNTRHGRDHHEDDGEYRSANRDTL